MREPAKWKEDVEAIKRIDDIAKEIRRFSNRNSAYEAVKRTILDVFRGSKPLDPEKTSIRITDDSVYIKDFSLVHSFDIAVEPGCCGYVILYNITTTNPCSFKENLWIARLLVSIAELIAKGRGYPFIMLSTALPKDFDLEKMKKDGYSYNVYVQWAFDRAAAVREWGMVYSDVSFKTGNVIRKWIKKLEERG